MLVRVGTTLEVVSGAMVAFDVDGTPVADANVDGRLLAFDAVEGGDGQIRFAQGPPSAPSS